MNNSIKYKTQYRIQTQIYNMSVKPQIFQQTKQTILRNKKQFIQIQLTQLAKRIGTLKTHNNQLKIQIKGLKSKPSRKLTICHGSSNGKNDHLKAGNKQNQSNNKVKVIDMEDTYVIANHGIKRYAVDNSIDDCGNQLTQYENKLQQFQRNKQKQLQSLQNQIIFLKKIWQYKQQIKSNQTPSEQQFKYKEQNINQTGEQTRNAMNIVKPYSFFQSIDSLDDSKTQHQITNRNRSTCMNNSSFMSQDPGPFTHVDIGENQMVQTRRKTMSLSLNNQNSNTNSNSNSNYGFNFGKKSNNNHNHRPNIQQFSISKITPNTDREPCHQKQGKNSCTSFVITNRITNPHHLSSISKSNLTTLNNSLSHSNSRTSMSYHMSNSGKSSMKRSQTSKSYAKIVTKLMCNGCKVQYRPNQYYTHIQECRQYLKIKLLEQKQKIQQEITQTLNSSLPYI